jgi:hypothetical protein
VFVFVSGTTAASLAVGDLVDIEGGTKDEFTIETDTCMRTSDCTLTEISPPNGGTITITKVGDGTVPAAEVLNPWDLAADDAEAEKWEGVLLKFENVSALSAPRSSTMSDTTLFDFNVTGPFNVQSSLVEFPTIARDDCFTEVSGIGDYFFNYKLLPRSTADIGAAGTGCLALEDATTCSDGMDNDFNGFADCEDFSCQENDPSCTMDTTIVAIQTGTIPENTRVRVTDVLITAIETVGNGAGKRFWVQDQVTAAPNTGVYVFQPGSATAITQAVDDRVTIEANVTEFNGQLTELTGSTSNPIVITDVNGGNPTTAVLDGISVADLSTMKQYEGTVVRLTNVPVVDATAGGCTPGPSEFCVFSIGDATNKLWVADRVFFHAGVAAECFSEVVGVMHYSDFNSRIEMAAISVTGGGTCL